MNIRKFLKNQIFTTQNKLFLFTSLIFIFGFILLLNGITKEKFNEKCENTKEIIEIFASQTEFLVDHFDDYDHNRAYYETKLRAFMEIFDVINERYAALYNSNLELLSKRDNETFFQNHNYQFDPFSYSNFVAEINDEKKIDGNLIVQWKLDNFHTREMYIFYRWVPIHIEVDKTDRYLLVTALSEQAITSQTSTQTIQGISGVLLGFFIVMSYYIISYVRRYDFLRPTAITKERSNDNERFFSRID
jgi:hypothetical protein